MLPSNVILKAVGKGKLPAACFGQYNKEIRRDEDRTLVSICLEWRGTMEDKARRRKAIAKEVQLAAGRESAMNVCQLESAGIGCMERLAAAEQAGRRD